MKLWEKVYRIVLVLFLLVLNICNIIIFRGAYQKSVDTVEKAGISRWKNIAASFSEDIAECGGNPEEGWSLFQSYVSDYYSENFVLELWKNRKLCLKSAPGSQQTDSAEEGEIFSDFLTEEEENKLLADGEKKGRAVILKKGDEKYCAVAGELSAGGYQLVLYEDVSDMLNIWREQMFFFVGLELVASILMAILLYGIMRRFLRPVSGISEAASHIAAGDFEYRLPVRGKDELSELAENMNRMAGQIEEHMARREDEARRKQEFIDALSHELRTPMTSIRGYAQLVQGAKLSGEKRAQYMDYIVKESGRILDIAESLRQVMFMRRGEFKKEPISLKNLGRELLRMAEPCVKEKRIAFDLEAEDDYIEGNETLLEILFMNLIRNSIHACHEQGRISVKLTGREAVVADDGAGMTEECREHIFEPFYREDKSRSRKMGGSGLGMYLCRQIADMHGFSIEIESEKGAGTCIRIFNNFFTTS